MKTRGNIISLKLLIVRNSIINRKKRFYRVYTYKHNIDLSTLSKYNRKLYYYVRNVQFDL